VIRCPIPALIIGKNSNTVGVVAFRGVRLDDRKFNVGSLASGEAEGSVERGLGRHPDPDGSRGEGAILF
jgi:hypothetical protein